VTVTTTQPIVINSTLYPDLVNVTIPVGTKGVKVTRQDIDDVQLRDGLLASIKEMKRTDLIVARFRYKKLPVYAVLLNEWFNVTEQHDENVDTVEPIDATTNVELYTIEIHKGWLWYVVHDVDGNEKQVGCVWPNYDHSDGQYWHWTCHAYPYKDTRGEGRCNTLEEAIDCTKQAFKRKI